MGKGGQRSPTLAEVLGPYMIAILAYLAGIAMIIFGIWKIVA